MQDLLSQLDTLRAKKDALNTEDLTGILENIVGRLSNENIDTHLREEIIKIAAYIETTKSEIIALTAGDASAKNMGSAVLQLDAVMKATEEAAHTIMDAADEIQEAVNAAGVDAALTSRIAAITARIYEACNFQDLTSQRITKVMRALEFTEAKIHHLVGLFGNDEHIPAKPDTAASREDGLLNGPQLPGAAPSQDEIDALFGAAK